jgi:hypothetical protein
MADDPLWGPFARPIVHEAVPPERPRRRPLVRDLDAADEIMAERAWEAELDVREEP